MIAYIDGKITFKCPAYVIIECGGIGYQVNISLHTYNYLQSLDQCKLFTHFHVKEDSQTLYGFFEETEKQLFKQLVSVSGIGPNTARTILSYVSPKELQQAVMSEDISLLESIKGIGAKSAGRIILELKDKFAKLELEPTFSNIPHNTNKKEALSALIMLGFSKNAAEIAINKILSSETEELKVEELIKKALKNM